MMAPGLSGRGGIGLRPRVYLLMATGVAFPLLVAGLVGSLWLRQTEERLHDAWLQAAEVVAADLDSKVTADLKVLQQLAAATGGTFAAPAEGAEQEALRRALDQLPHRAPIYLIDRQGNVAAEALAGTGSGIPAAVVEDVREALATGRPHLSDPVSDGHGPAIYEAVPIRDYRGEVVGLAMARLDLGRKDFADVIGLVARGESGTADLVDDQGRILASSDPKRFGTRMRCGASFGDRVRKKAPQAGRCRECHGRADGPAGEIDADEVYAIAPLPSAPWGVVVRQAATEAVPFEAGVPWIALGAVLYAFLVVAFSWGAARSVTFPVSVLTTEAERISAGDLSRTIPYLGEDEIGRLGQALEKMRSSLRDLILRVANQNAALEERVEERTHALAEANQKLREREAMRAEALRKVITAQEDERKRIARELHDETSQSLAALAMGIDASAEAIRAGGHPRLDEVKALATRSLEDVHRLILDLRPSVLDDLGLLAAVEWYADRTLRKRGISVRCEFEEPGARLSPEMETALFRICQEALGNVARHAQASAVLVELGLDEREIRVSIEDDGRGFDPAASPADDRRKHWGLVGIRERAELLGGAADVESAVGKGTRVEVRIPLPVTPTE